MSGEQVSLPNLQVGWEWNRQRLEVGRHPAGVRFWGVEDVEAVVALVQLALAAESGAVVAYDFVQRQGVLSSHGFRDDAKPEDRECLVIEVDWFAAGQEMVAKCCASVR